MTAPMTTGSHHIGLTVAKLEQSAAFFIEPLGPGPARHMICYEPSGIRVEFIWPGN